MVEIKKIAVLGAGNGGFMCAADFAHQGYEVRLFDALKGKLNGLKEKGSIEVLDIDSKPTGMFGEIALASEDITAVLKGADVVINPVPYFVSETYAKLAAPYLEEGQTVICLGKGGASLTWAKVLKEAGVKHKIFLSDCNTLPYGASRLNDNQVRLEARVHNLMVASFPSKDIDYVYEIFSTLWNSDNGYTIRKAANPIDTLLVDYNAITHTPPMICNAARIEMGDKDFHLFGVQENTPAVCKVMKRLDRERMAIGEKLGMKQNTLEEEVTLVKWNRNGEDYPLPFYEAMHNPFLEVCEGPFKLDARHLTEDIPFGLVTYSSLGKMLGVPTPVVDAIITMAEALLDRDFWSEGRTVEEMGLDPKWTIKQVNDYLYNGKI